MSGNVRDIAADRLANSSLLQHMKLLKPTLPSCLLLLALAFSGAGTAQAAVVLTPAFGGEGISADTAATAPSPAWTSLGPITIREEKGSDFGVGTGLTLILRTPSGFEFNTNLTPSIAFAPNRSISAASAVLTDGSTLVITLTVNDANRKDTLEIGGANALQVRPTATTPLAGGRHIYRPGTGGGTAAINGITTSTDGSTGSNFGSLTEVAGAATTVLVETSPTGAGMVVPAQSMTSGSTLKCYAVARDAYGNFVANATANAWSLVNKTGGVANGDLVPASDARSATFTAHLTGTAKVHVLSGALTPVDSGMLTVVAGTASKLTFITAPQSLTAGVTSGTMTVQLQDASGNPVNSAASRTVNLAQTSTGGLFRNPEDTATITSVTMSPGTSTVSFRYRDTIAGTPTLTASSSGLASGIQTEGVNAGAFTKVQLLVPGESAAPGTATGKVGTPSGQTAGSAFAVTVNGVDAHWNKVTSADGNAYTMSINSSDARAVLPADANLSSGTRTFTITLQQRGSSTITVTDLDAPALTDTSPPISVGIGIPAARTTPIVAIHDSELTRALEPMPATGDTPTARSTPIQQWWPTNWHYFVMPESVKEVLRSDGTAYEVVGDADISMGRLLATNGQPRYPIVISLASEAIQDDEIAELTNYVASGGTLFVGSSAFTRHPDGTTRGDFALADQMGLHMVNASLQNWAPNVTFTKVLNESLVSHIPGGMLYWHLPSSADEVSWGTSPEHGLPGQHAVWQVQASDAVVVAQGDASPYLSVKQYGKGRFIYCAAMQPLIGHGGYAPGIYAYAIFRQAIEQAFASFQLPVPRLSPWPYAYDAALNVRHDLENYQPLIRSIESSAQYEAAHGVSGDYYFCSGTLREEMADAAEVIASLRRAVSDYGATIGSHNGGLVNPNAPSLSLSDYDYWHWGPDEALDATPPGFASGQAYALASISNSFNDIEGWLSGLTSGTRSWVSCYFNSTREDSYEVLEALKVKTAGEQKLGPFPHWTVSTRTSGKRYSFVSLPVSDWFVGSQIAQSMESGHTASSVRQLVDFYYSLGGLINLYSHSLSDGSGYAGSVLQDYINYSVTKPRIWSTNAVGIYNWWLARSQAQVVPSYSTSGNQAVITLSIQGATDPQTAVELLLPQLSYYNLQVLSNGKAVSGNAYRATGQLVKLLVGTSVTNVQIRYHLAPLAVSDCYEVTPNASLTVPAAGVLSNDVAGLGGSLTATLASGPAYGTLALNPDGGFDYTPATNFSGVDSFSYQTYDGMTNSSPAVVTLLVKPLDFLFSDDFARPASSDPLAPWQTAWVAWALTEGVLQGSSGLQSYAYACVPGSWTDYFVEARIRFPEGAFGGGVGGRLDALSGAHYAAWVYPETSAGGSGVLKLIKFQNWVTFGYQNASYLSMQEATLPAAGTNWHTVKLALLGEQIAVYYDGALLISATDVEALPYRVGGISLDTWTAARAYPMSVDDVVVGPLVVADHYAVNQNVTLTVPAPGPLGNDTGLKGTNLTATLISGPTNGTLSQSPGGGFSYTPATNFAGTDSFVYQAHDGLNDLGTATVRILVEDLNSHDPLPTVLGLNYGGDGSVTVTFFGTPGTQYLVQSAPSLAPPVSWTNVATNTAGTDGRWTFTDTSVLSQVQRYFRAAKP